MIAPPRSPALSRALRFVLLPLAFLLVLVATGCTRPPPSASATIQYQMPDPAQAEAILLPLLPPDDKSVTMRFLRNTELFSIIVVDEDPQRAAQRANDFIETLQQSLKSSHPEVKLIIWERASAPKT